MEVAGGCGSDTDQRAGLPFARSVAGPRSDLFDDQPEVRQVQGAGRVSGLDRGGGCTTPTDSARCDCEATVCAATLDDAVRL